MSYLTRSIHFPVLFDMRKQVFSDCLTHQVAIDLIGLGTPRDFRGNGDSPIDVGQFPLDPTPSHPLNFPPCGFRGLFLFVLVNLAYTKWIFMETVSCSCKTHLICICVLTGLIKKKNLEFNFFIIITFLFNLIEIE